MSDYHNNFWLMCAYISAITFAVSNGAKTRLAEETGTVTILYNAMGQLVTSTLYMLSQCVFNKKTRNVCWLD